MLEQRIEELTQAVKELTAAMKGGTGATNAAPAAAPKTTKKTSAPPAEAASMTKETLFAKLQEHGGVFGLKETKKLMVKHGADAVNTTTASVPAASYQKLYDAAVADLTKGAQKSEEVFS